MTPLAKPRLHAPLTQFIGRGELLAQVGDLVRRERLATLVGPGGIGKTRLALELARALASEFPDGVAFVALDSVQNPTDVAWRAASALRASDQSSRTAIEHVIRHLERANIVAALEWSLSIPEERPRAAELAALLRYQWVTGRYLSDGRYRLERVLAEPEVTGRNRGEVLWVLSWVALIQGDHADGERHLTELRGLAESLDDPMLRAQANHWGGLLLLFQGRAAEAVPLYAAAIATFRAVGDIAAWQTALFQYGLCLLYSGDPNAALVSQSELIALSDSNGEAWCKAYAYWVRGLTLYHRGDLSSARTAACAALAIQDDFEDGICVAHTLLLLSCVASAAGDPISAARFQGAADTLWGAMGTKIESFGPDMARNAAAARASSRAALGEDAWAKHCADVATKDLGGVINWASNEATRLQIEVVAAAPQHLPGVRFTGREAEVAAHLARGLTNKEIAAALTISIRTAEGHVEQVLKKVGACTRAQATAILLGGQEAGSTQSQPNPPSGNSMRR